MGDREKLDRGFYIAGWCVLAAAAAVFIGIKLTGYMPGKYGIPCLFHVMTGYYCPGCGGTRAVAALVRGEVFRAFRYHPLVPYTAVTGCCFMISQTIERVSEGKIKIGMHFRTGYLWAALAMTLLNFLIKNLALAVWHTDLLSW